MPDEPDEGSVEETSFGPTIRLTGWLTGPVGLFSTDVGVVIDGGTGIEHEF